jgi:hypothetical protein
MPRDQGGKGCLGAVPCQFEQLVITLFWHLSNDVRQRQKPDKVFQIIFRRLVLVELGGGFKFEVRQIGRGCHPNIPVPTLAPSSRGVRVCIETEMSSSL